MGLRASGWARALSPPLTLPPSLMKQGQVPWHRTAQRSKRGKAEQVQQEAAQPGRHPALWLLTWL